MAGFVTYQGQSSPDGQSKNPVPASECSAMSFFFLLLFVMFSGTTPALAQYFVRGQDPASVRWQQIQTEHFRIIFPDDYVQKASYIADILEYSYEPVSRTLGNKPRRVPVILHNQTVVPNGFVSWAPARLEMFSNPPPDNDPHNWLERLAVHEFRHVVQVDKLNQGVTGLFSRIFGEHITGISLGLFVPLWWLEGDAVSVETALTHGGRGRRPAFEQGLRAQVLDKGIYSYDKAMLGSFRDYVPNHYELGYQLVAMARCQYGAGIWDKVIDQVARRPHTLFPFSLGLRNHAGVGAGEHYRQTFAKLKNAWTWQMDQHDYTPVRTVNKNKHIYTHYRPMAFLDETTLLVLKTGMGDIPKMIALGFDGKEQVLFTPGFYNSRLFSMAGKLVAWSETRPDPRWEHRSWSEIHTYDFSTQKNGRITRQTRFFSPAVSPDATRIAVAEVTSRNEYALVIIDAFTGDVLHRIALPGNPFLMDPQWHPDGRRVVAIAQDENGKRILDIDLQNNRVTTLFHAGYTDIARPRYLEPGVIAFNGAFSGIDNVYILDEYTGEVFQLISSRFGGIDALLSADGDKLAWSDYTAMGYRAAIHEGPLPEVLPLGELARNSVDLYRTLVEQEGEALVTKSNITRSEHQVSDYQKGAHLINIHSWSPFALHIDYMEARPGVSFFSQNALSTSVASLGYEWDVNERLGKYFFNYTYLGRYPVFDFSAERAARRAYYVDQGTPDELIPFLWLEKSFRFRVSVPLRFRRGPVFYGLTPSVRAGITRADAGRDSPDFFESNELFPLHYRILAYRQVRKVDRDIRPRWGQVLDLHYRHTPFSGGSMGSVQAGQLINFFPGIWRHHSLRLAAVYQEHNRAEPKPFTVNFSFPNLVPYPRGVTGRFDERTYGLMADYAFPLAYPEWTIPSVLYVKRLHLNVFADHAWVRYRLMQDGNPRLAEDRLRSAGIDIVGNMHFFRLFAPFEVGLRTIYLPDEEQFVFRLLFSFEIY